jgi:hypothetical protein
VAFHSFEHCDVVRILQVCTDGDAQSDTGHAGGKRLDQFGKIDVNFTKDMVTGFVPWTIKSPSSLKKPGGTQH